MKRLTSNLRTLGLNTQSAHWRRWFLALLSGLYLTGCAGLHNGQPTAKEGASTGSIIRNTDNNNSGLYFNGEFAQRLETMPASFSTEVTGTPLGEQVTVSAEPSYMAASGRVCRKLATTTGNNQSSILVCRIKSGVWQSVRMLVR